MQYFQLITAGDYHQIVLKKLLSINVKKVTKPTNKVIKNITMINIFFFIKSIIVNKIMCYIFLS